MKIQYLNFIVVLNLFFLSACNYSKPLEWIYYDRVKFILLSDDEENENVFLCTKEASEQETKEKAQKANQYYSQKFKKITEEFTENFLTISKEKAENGEDISFIEGVDTVMELQKKSKKLSADVEKIYQCLLVDSVERE